MYEVLKGKNSRGKKFSGLYQAMEEVASYIKSKDSGKFKVKYHEYMLSGEMRDYIILKGNIINRDCETVHGSIQFTMMLQEILHPVKKN